MKRILLIFLFLPALAWGNHRTITSDSLPYTCALQGTAYSETVYVDGAITSQNGTAINFYYTSHDVVLRGVNGLPYDTVYFGADGSEDCIGINMGYGIGNDGG